MSERRNDAQDGPIDETEVQDVEPGLEPHPPTETQTPEPVRS